MARISIGGGKIYLFTQTGNTKLIITAHGGKEKNRFKPPGGATLYFCSMHGKSTSIDADDIVASLTTDKSRSRKMKSVGFHPFFMGDLPDYSLSKFAGKHGGGVWENYNEYDEMTKKKFDILTPRNRWFSKEVNLSYVLNHKKIQEKGYREIYCSFCRS